jgi:hypothetical protein
MLYKKIVYLVLSVFFLTSFRPKKEKLIDIFKTYIVGEFDNSQQVVHEIKKGKQIHPLAVHVNAVANNKFINLPKDVKGFFLLEESYYQYPNKPLDIKPYLFYFEENKNTITLTVYQFPKEYKKEELRNDNANLKFDFTTLQLSPTFKGATYIYNATNKSFSTKSINHLPNNMTFTLIETFTKNQLQVMELLEKDGQSLTPYSTPILYDRR